MFVSVPILLAVLSVRSSEESSGMVVYLEIFEALVPSFLKLYFDSGGSKLTPRVFPPITVLQFLGIMSIPITPWCIPQSLVTEETF